MSAQDTLEEATALFTGLSTKENFDDEEPTNGEGSEGSEGNGQKDGESEEMQEIRGKNFEDVDDWDL